MLKENIWIEVSEKNDEEENVKISCQKDQHKALN